MKIKINIFFILFGLIATLASCEKDGDKVKMLETPVAPEIQTMPDLTLKRDQGAKELTFACSSVDPGFNASATYYLEAVPTGSDFTDALLVYSGVKGDNITMTISDLNQKLLQRFPEDATTSIDFRMRAVLVVDGGEGAPGTGNQPFEYISKTVTADATIYGLLRLDLMNSGREQKIVSPLANGVYRQYVKLDPANPFTLFDPESDTTYGVADGALAEGGSAIKVGDAGWYDLTVDVVNSTVKNNPYMIGVVGSATANGWNAPDQKMDYDPVTGTWSITLDLADGEFKFRKNDGWAWNLGGTPEALEQSGDNIVVSAGTYTIALTIVNGTTGTYSIVKQ